MTKKRLLFCLLQTLVLFFLTAAASLAQPIKETVSIDVVTRYQQMEGWGTSLVGYGDLAGPNSLYHRPEFARMYARDLGCNILRVALNPHALKGPSGRLDDPVELGEDLQGNIAKLNFNHERVGIYGQVAQYLRDNALEPKEVRIVGALWSPPHWMKSPTGAEVAFLGQGTPQATPFVSWNSTDTVGGRLTQTPENLLQFRRYVAAWVKGFEQRFGVNFYALSLQNEVSFENPFDSCTYSDRQGPDTDADGDPDPEGGQWWQYASALAAIREEFQQKGITTKIKGPHMANLGEKPSNPWALHFQMSFIDAVKNHNDPTLINFMDFYNSNGYLGNDADAVKMWHAYLWGKDSLSAEPWAFWLFAPGTKNVSDKPTWVSEDGGAAAAWLTGSNGTPGNGAITVAQRIHNAVVHGDVSAYVYWQILNDASDSPDAHSLTGRTLSTTEKKYCAFKHFSRFIRPGATRVKADFSNGQSSVGGANRFDTLNSLNVSAFLHERNKTVTIVLVNMKNQEYEVDLRPFSTPDLNVQFTPPGVNAVLVYRTSATESWTRLPDLKPSGGKVTVNVPPYSVITVYGGGPTVSFLPIMRSEPADFLGVAISNPKPEPIHARIHAFGPDGALLPLPENPVLKEIPPEGQTPLMAEEWFGVPREEVMDGWLRIETTGQSAGVFAQSGDYGLSRLDGAVATRRPAWAFYLTRVYEGTGAFRGQDARTLVNIINPHGSPTNLILQLHTERPPDPPGPGVLTVFRNLPPYGSLTSTVSELFGTSYAAGYIVILATGGQGVVASGLVTLPGKSTSFALNAVTSDATGDLFSAQLAHIPGHLFTSVRLFNLGGVQEKQVTLTAISDDGAIVGSPATLTIQPGGYIERDASDLFGDVPLVGSLHVSAPPGEGLMGDVVFGLTDCRYAAAARLDTELSSKIVFSHVANVPGLLYTGLALFNPNTDPAPAVIKLKVFSAAGIRTGTHQFELGSGKRVSKLLSEFVPEAEAQAGGYILLTSTLPIVAQELFGTPSTSLLSAVPGYAIE